MLLWKFHVVQCVSKYANSDVWTTHPRPHGSYRTPTIFESVLSCCVFCFVLFCFVLSCFLSFRFDSFLRYFPRDSNRNKHFRGLVIIPIRMTWIVHDLYVYVVIPLQNHGSLTTHWFGLCSQKHGPVKVDK